jgi:hypothetical protein
MFQARPVYTAYYNGRFDVISASRMPQEEFANVKNPLFKSMPITGPLLVASIDPSTADEINHIMLHKKAPADISAFPQHYAAYEADTPSAKDAGSKAKDIASLKQKDPTAVAAIDDFLKSNNLDIVKVGYLPVVTRKTDMVAVVDHQSGKFYGFVFANPW